MTDSTIRPLRGIRIAIAAVVSALALAVAALTAAPASAADDSGWLRLGHLSPDTKSVDVSVAAVSGGQTVFELAGVGYGDVSGYEELPDGAYTISMVPSGASGEGVPVVSETITIDAGTATTVAAYGPASDLQVAAFADDLTAPAQGNARIRLVQASTVISEVDVETTTGRAIAEDAASGTATGYAEVPAGEWELEVEGGEISDVADVEVAAGSVSTLFVLDTADGGLTVLPVVDSAAAAEEPEGGVQTGGGYLALDFAQRVAAVFTGPAVH